MGPAIELEEKMAQANDSKAQACMYASYFRSMYLFWRISPIETLKYTSDVKTQCIPQHLTASDLPTTILLSQEALLFERAEADSLTALERQVFFKSRILNYGDEDQLSGVFWFFKFVAWLVVVVYTLGMSFYVCLFAVKAGRATSVQWMISFWVAFVEVRLDSLWAVPPTGL